MKTCNNCGNAVEDNVFFCANCGTSFDITSYKDAVNAALSGDNRGYEYLYNSTAAQQYNLVLSKLGNEGEATAVLQEAYGMAWAQLNTVQNPDIFPDWIGGIVENALNNALAKRQLVQNQPAQNQPVQNQPVQNQPVQNQPAQNQPAQNQPVQNQPVQNQPAQNQPAQNQPVQNQPAQNQPAQNQPMQNQPVQNQPVQNQPMQNQSVPVQAQMSGAAYAMNNTAAGYPTQKATSSKESFFKSFTGKMVLILIAIIAVVILLATLIGYILDESEGDFGDFLSQDIQQEEIVNVDEYNV